jgi:hypothetical protein
MFSGGSLARHVSSPNAIGSKNKSLRQTDRIQERFLLYCCLFDRLESLQVRIQNNKILPAVPAFVLIFQLAALFSPRQTNLNNSQIADLCIRRCVAG